MARGIYGGGLQGLSGSINREDGGWTYQKNSAIRRRVIPIQPNTISQMRVRNNMFALNSAWRTVLSPAQRIAWNNAAKGPDWKFWDSVSGTYKNRTGNNLFISLNANLALYYQDTAVRLTDVPDKYTPGNVYFYGVEVAAQGGTAQPEGLVLSLYSGTLGLWEATIRYYSAAQSSGRTSFRVNQLRYIDGDQADSELNDSAQYFNHFGSLNDKAGYLLYYQMFIINLANGLKREAGRGIEVIQAATKHILGLSQTQVFGISQTSLIG